jgi:hypothetical protein
MLYKVTYTIIKTLSKKICYIQLHVVNIPNFKHKFQIYKLLLKRVRFKVFTAVTMKNTVFWDVAPCRYRVNRRFGETYRLHLQGIRDPRARNQREQVAADCFLARGFLTP